MSRPTSERPGATTVLSHLGVMVVVSVVLGVVVSGLAIPVAGVLGFAARSTADTMYDLPTELETTELAQRTTILDADGNILASVFDENRINVSLKQVSRRMVEAVIAIEDYRFYEHGALDVKGTFRALVTNLGSGGVVQGGSTITQQLVKQTLLNQAATPKERAAVTDDTYARKLKELRYAIALEKKYSKDWILERYLNTVFFGDNAYGVQAAAQNYFGVDAKDLNVNQSATLAGLIQSPSAYNPTSNGDRALERRDVVLDRMAELNVIPEQRADKIKKAGLKLDPKKVDRGCVNTNAQFFCNYAIEYLLRDKSLGKTKAERERLIYAGGLTIKTTVDLDYQEAADEAVESNVRATDRAIGGLAMIEPGTGDVKATAQSRPMGAADKKGETFLNYVVPSQYGDSNGFQAGSTFKAFVLADAIEKGTDLGQTLPAPSVGTFNYSDYEVCTDDQYLGEGTFEIPNSVSSAGSENLYTGTRNSINTFFLNLEQITGICDPYQLAKAMGVQLTAPEGKKNSDGVQVVSPEMVPTFTLGVADVSPLEMAEAYATFGARGLHCDSRPVTAIEDADGNLLKKYEPQCQQVMRETTADAVNDILSGVINGGFASAQALSVPAAGKTGTTGGPDGSPAVWFVGYTPQVATAVMLAGANEFGTPIGLDGLTVNGNIVSASGTALAAPIWGAAMRGIEGQLDYEEFVYPSTVPGAGDTSVYVPPPPPSNSGGGSSSNNNGGGNGNGNGGGRGGRR